MERTDEIRDLERTRVKKVIERDVLIDIMQNVERKYATDISQNAKDYGLTNQAARDNALQHMLATDDKYMEMKKDLNALNYEIMYLDIDIKFELREFRRFELAEMIQMDICININLEGKSFNHAWNRLVCLRHAIALAKSHGMSFELGEQLLEDIDSILAEVSAEEEAEADLMTNKQIWG